MIDTLLSIEKALDPYAPYMFIAIFLWYLGGFLYETLSWVAKRVRTRAPGPSGPWRRCKAVVEALLDRFRQGLH